VLPGDTSDLRQGPWPQLKALLARTYRTHDGVRAPDRDAGGRQRLQHADGLQLGAAHPMSRVIAVKGTTRHVLIGAPSVVDVTLSGKS
jgi:hypothetical protein